MPDVGCSLVGPDGKGIMLLRSYHAHERGLDRRLQRIPSLSNHAKSGFRSIGLLSATILTQFALAMIVTCSLPIRI